MVLNLNFKMTVEIKGKVVMIETNLPKRLFNLHVVYQHLLWS